METANTSGNEISRWKGTQNNESRRFLACPALVRAQTDQLYSPGTAATKLTAHLPAGGWLPFLMLYAMVAERRSGPRALAAEMPR